MFYTTIPYGVAMCNILLLLYNIIVFYLKANEKFNGFMGLSAAKPHKSVGAKCYMVVQSELIVA